MAVPRHRQSNARKNSRRAHHAKRPKSAATCTNCGSAHMPHCMCPACGYYKNRPVMRQEEE